ncbi:type I pullulanase [Bifidobacterium simiiventris]|uniref:type I pullulanase n=1 Tax=Bifidobacterium simiiventris TaxID=2834434 RepID=UPI001C591B50|nr:type I pullulanase [Bifidobacterium simiiventris]MBW3079475.1 type I pullulanase [Bifidobacterium simiiventris]
MEQLVDAPAVAAGTPAEQAQPCPDYPVYTGDDLGAFPDASGTTFRVWAPSASGVTLRLFTSGSAVEDAANAITDHDGVHAPGRTPDRAVANDGMTAADETGPIASVDPTETHELTPGANDTWLVRCDGVGHGTYYDYLVRFADGTINRTADPWARAAGVNGRRSMVVDLAQTNPDGWERDARPHTPASDLVIWETHIGDFSNDPHSGIPADHRGTYLAFTDNDSSVDNAGKFPTCVAYLKRLGITAVQLMPFYDYGSIDESLPRTDPKHGFNWGYDPLNYNVPEGSYSTDPFHGEVRIRECKQMIQALHAAGIKVIMDVVYNHMFSTDNWFERMIPGYALRRRADGSFANGSACSNDVASERAMMRKYIVDSAVYWASEYHIDGFRFDLMGLIDVDTMNAVRAALDALPDGASILMHGEPWAAGQTALPAGVVLADKRGMPYLDPRIGAFCDSTRDAVRGHIFYHWVPGYLTGAAADYAEDIRHAENGWRGTKHETASVAQVIQYVSAHDDLTLWDKLCAVMRRMPNETDYSADDPSCADLMRANRLAAGIVFSAAGVPFLLGGEEFARTKHGNSDSYCSPASLNQLDWRRAERFSSLVDHYAALIRLRRGNPAYFGGARMIVPRVDETVVFRVGDDCIAINPTAKTQLQLTVDLEKTGPYGELSPIAPDEWSCVYCSSPDAPTAVENRRLSLPPYSFTVWRRKR